MGAWIEIMIIDMDDDIKYVAPLVGAWIEIIRWHQLILLLLRRSPRGSVD